MKGMVLPMFGVQFYPTPTELVDKMMGKLNLKDFHNQNISVLEPSAGKGDIIEGFKRLLNHEEYYYTLKHYYMVNGKRKIDKSKFFKNSDEFFTFINEKFSPKQELKSFDEALDYIDNCINNDLEEYDIDVHYTKPYEKILPEIETIEIDKDLCSVLKGKGYIPINADFLQYNSYKRYDLILMNPPFADGEMHLIKALKLIENGGQLVCILNAETLKNPYTNWRQELLNRLNFYGADIEYIDNAFSNAEHTTDVEIALVYVNIPPKTVDKDLLENLLLGEEYERNYQEYKETQLATNDAIANLIKQYDLEARLGIKIIDDFYSMQQYIPKRKDSNEVAMIGLSVLGCSDETTLDMNPVNKYIRGLREKYWNLLFMSNEIRSILTETSYQQYMRRLRDFRNYDFTFSNIKQLQIDISKNLNNNINESILKQFDDFTYKYSLDKNTNVHYFNGWRTNSAFIVKPKVIIPMYGIYDSRWSYGWCIGKCNGYLDELEKVFTYLDGNATQGSTVNEILQEYSYAKKYNGEKIHFKYFDVELKKKGTIHIWFTNEQLLKKFNIFGCQKHGWLPNCYGKKAYKDMTQEEKSVVDEFEGEKEYEKVMNNSSVYLSGNQMFQLEMKE